MKEKILFILVEPFADWEAAYLSSLLTAIGGSRYEVKTVSLTKEPIKSLGGFTILPDYSIEALPKDFAGVILIGGMSWRTEAAKKVRVVVSQAIAEEKILGAICDATVFLGAQGILNQVYHTSNDLKDLKAWAREAYTGENLYKKEPAVRDGRIVTANGTAALEFAREILLALEAGSTEQIEEWYTFHKKGLYEAPFPKI